MKSGIERALEWAFALVSVVFAWNLDISTHLSTFAEFVGAFPGGLLHNAIVQAGPPLVLVMVAALAMLLYERVLWRYWPQSRCMRGWWIYALAVRSDPISIKVAGYFFLDHRIESASVPEGRAFYLDDEDLVHRGNWTAQNVWADRTRIRSVFSMRAHAPTREPLPSHYDGYLELEFTTHPPIVGLDSWSGYFNDLGDRHDVWGPIVAERIKRSLAKNAADARLQLDKYAVELASRAMEILS